MFKHQKTPVMKQNLFVLTSSLLLLAACNSAPEADKATTAEQQTVAAAEGTKYGADLAASSVSFIGTKPTGQHAGSFNLKEGSLTVKEGALTAGNFVIDIASIKSIDKDTAGTAMLMGHLSSPDFFDVAKYSTASFEVTKVETYDSTKLKSLLAGATHIISGNLKLKDSTKNVTFPARVSISDNAVTAEADFNIDRTQWGMAYGNDKSLKDKFIRPEVNIKLNIAAKK
jgi:polyisoprenoid-binding protein YceI